MDDEGCSGKYIYCMVSDQSNSVYYVMFRSICCHECSCSSIVADRPFQTQYSHWTCRLLQLLLRSELIGVSTLLLAAVGRSWRQTRVALAADHLFAVVL